MDQRKENYIRNLKEIYNEDFLFNKGGTREM